MISKATIQYIQGLQHKKNRDETGAFIAEGPKVILELLRHNFFECQAIYCSQIWIDEHNKSLAIKYISKINIIKDFELEKISALSKANNVLAVFNKKEINKTVDFTNKVTLFLDDIQDPGNLGTIIRIADWFNIKNIFCSENTADCYNPKVVQSTMASLARVNIVYENIISILEKNILIKKYVTTLNGKPLGEIKKIKEGILIIGNESKGVSKQIIALADEKITIEKIGQAESLNAAVATGIILHHILNK